VNIFFDTTVLVAASVQDHPHHAQALPAVRRAQHRQDKGFISVHSIAEVYASLTRLPVRPRIHPLEAQRIVVEDILPYFEAVLIDPSDYVNAMSHVAANVWIGAKIYDALLLSCAAKCGAERVYTFNLGDFRALASGAMRGKICAP
jgi:predicted nucleic acid-binding protein